MWALAYFRFMLMYSRETQQKNCNLGGYPYKGSCGDDLMENVKIYDTVERQHAGFQNMLQDLWFGSSAPKYYKWSNEKLLLVAFLFLYTFTTFAPTITCVCFKLNHVYIISLVIKYICWRQVIVSSLET